jgi:hypothetical protein
MVRRSKIIGNNRKKNNGGNEIIENEKYGESAMAAALAAKMASA